VVEERLQRDFKTVNRLLEQMCSSNRFHSDRAATANERALNFVAVLGSMELVHAQLYKPVDTPAPSCGLVASGDGR